MPDAQAPIPSSAEQDDPVQQSANENEAGLAAPQERSHREPEAPDQSGKGSDPEARSAANQPSTLPPNPELESSRSTAAAPPDSLKEAQKGSLAQVFTKRAGRSVWLTGHKLPAFDETDQCFWMPGVGAPPEPTPSADTTPPIRSFKHIATKLELEAQTQSPVDRAFAAALASAKFAYNRGQFEQALEHYRSALDVLDMQLEPETKQLEACLTDLIDVYIFLDRNHDALITARRLSELWGDKKKDKDSIALMVKMATAQQRVGQLDQAEAVLVEAIELASDVLAADDPVHNRLNRAFIETHRKLHKNGLLADSDKEALLANTKNVQTPLQRRRLQEPTRASRIGVGLQLTLKPLQDWIKSLCERVMSTPLLRSNALLLCLSGLLLVCTAATFFGLHFERGGQVSPSEELIGQIAGQEYKSVDNRKTIAFASNHQCNIWSHGSYRQAKYKPLAGGSDDLLNILCGAISNSDELWLTRTDAGVIDQDGTVLYGKRAPELMVAQRMWWYADYAADLYRKTHLYPSRASQEVSAPGYLYTNPFSGKAESASIVYKKFAAPVKSWTQRTKDGQFWEGEPPWRPGEVHCACLDYCRFFVRGFDRNARPLTSSQPHQYFTIELQDGVDVTAAELKALSSERSAVNKPLHVFVANGQELEWSIILVRTVIPALCWFILVVALVMCVTSGKTSDPATIRILSLMTMLASVSVLAFWYYWALSPKW